MRLIRSLRRDRDQSLGRRRRETTQFSFSQTGGAGSLSTDSAPMGGNRSHRVTTLGAPRNTLNRETAARRGAFPSAGFPAARGATLVRVIPTSGELRPIGREVVDGRLPVRQGAGDAPDCHVTVTPRSSSLTAGCGSAAGAAGGAARSPVRDGLPRRRWTLIPTAGSSAGRHLARRSKQRVAVRWPVLVTGGGSRRLRAAPAPRTHRRERPDRSRSRPAAANRWPAPRDRSCGSGRAAP